MSKLQNFLNFIWPVKKQELPVFLSMTGLMFCILFIQNLIRALKDSIVNTLIGTEIISFLKFWGVMPASFLVVILYVKAVNYVEGKKIFYGILSSFLAFFFLFAFYIFPNHETLHLNDETIKVLVSDHPHFKWFILLIAKWGFSLFYIISELWPNVVIALLFWQFINQVTTVEQSKRFYGLFGLLGQTGLFFSGQFLINLPSISNQLIEKYALTGSLTLISVQVVLSVVIILGLTGIVFFWLLNNRILNSKTTIVFKAKAQKITLAESISMILKSRYIRLIAIIMICYGVSINLAETPWKSLASKAYTEVEDYAAFTGNYLSYTGICTVVLVLINSTIIRTFGWFYSAIITPLVVLTTGLSFFITSNFDGVSFKLANLFMVSDPLMLVIVAGMIQNTLSKSTKYTFFDITKEMSYVPLNDELKSKGKAAVDIIGAKAGKSLSSLIQSSVFIILPSATYESISIYLMCVFSLICLVWIWAVKELAKEYSSITTSQEKPV
jgi:AAA family ATP:ADP antiporter